MTDNVERDGAKNPDERGEGSSHVLRQSEEEERKIANPEEELPAEVQKKIEVLQKLLAYQGTEKYSKIQKKAGKKLGMSVRGVQRLLKA
jgi:hypothetical protein